MPTMKTNPMHVFAPITRVSDEDRIVEGIAFASEVVAGEGGIRLTRAAMEDATPDYMAWANVREMHQPSAVGTMQSVEWKDGMAFVRCHVVDDSAWEKVKAGVYKGFSVGVAPLVMRGLNVVKAAWKETSLVDRPKDPVAKFSIVRMDDADAAVDAEVEEEEEAPNDTPGYARAEDVTALIARIDGLTGENSELLIRLDTIQAENTSLVSRLSAIEKDLPCIVRVENPEEYKKTWDKLLERMTAVEQAPAVRVPVLNTNALVPADGDTRRFAHNEYAGPSDTQITRAALQTEFDALLDTLPNEPDAEKRTAGVIRLNVLKQQIQQNH